MRAKKDAWGRLVAASAVVALGACAASPRPVAAPVEPPLSYPPAARERVLRIALEEWRDWGGAVVDGGADRPAPGTGAEARPENFPRVLAYWRAVDGDGAGAVARNRPLYRAALAGDAAGGGLWREPYWSAAFVGYVMRGAGVDAREFPPSAAHATYVDAMIGAAERFPDAAPFVPHGPAERAPQPGDIVCADRGGRNPLTDWRQRAADAGRFRPMHCDIVVNTAPGVVEAVGGNVADSVTLTRFPADAGGYLLPRPPGAPVWFAVFENRLGCLPPWGPPCPVAPTATTGSPAS